MDMFPWSGGSVAEVWRGSSPGLRGSLLQARMTGIAGDKAARQREASMPVQHFDWIAYHAATRGAQIAMVDLHTGREFTYAQFDDRVGRLASGLRSAYGVKRGDRIGVLAHNSSDLFEIQFACARLGAVFVPMNWRLTVPELTFIVGDCAPVVLIYDQEFEDAAIALAAACGVPNLCARDPDNSAYEQLIATEAETIAPEPLTHDDIAT